MKAKLSLHLNHCEQTECKQHRGRVPFFVSCIEMLCPYSWWTDLVRYLDWSYHGMSIRPGSFTDYSKNLPQIKFTWIHAAGLSNMWRKRESYIYMHSTVNLEEMILTWKTVGWMQESVCIIWEQAALISLTRPWCISLASGTHQSPGHDCSHSS